jgi:hypothetical protein
MKKKETIKSKTIILALNITIGIFILLNSCTSNKIKPLYSCSKEMLDQYCTPQTFKDTVSEALITFNEGSIENYYEKDLVETDPCGIGPFICKQKYTMERYKRTLVFNSIKMEYFLQIIEMVNGGYIYDFLKVSIYDNDSQKNTIGLLMADQSEFIDCRGIDTGAYIGDTSSGYSQLNDYLSDFISFKYLDSLNLYNKTYYAVYNDTYSYNGKECSLYFTKEEGIIAFQTQKDEFYIKQ